MIDPPQLADTREQAAAVIHLTIPRSEIQQVMGPAFGELMAAIQAQGLTPAGPAFSHHFRMEPGTFDFEVGVPVVGTATPVGRVRPGRLPAARVARTVYHGGYEGLGAAWGEFDAWLKAAGHRTASDMWESYVAGPDSSPNPAEWRTELNRPLAG